MVPEANPISISTVTPVYSGQVYLQGLVEALARVREEWRANGLPIDLVESIFVNDSAIDDSLSVLLALQEKFDWIQIVTLSNNFGQHSATVAGILHSCGDWVISIDEDLQHDPKYFVRLFERAVTDGSDVVYAKPESRVHQSFWRDQGSIQYKKILSILTANPHIPSFNSYRLMRGSIARAVASVCSHETYFDIALCWFTGRIGTITLPLHDRRYAITKKSGYSLKRLLSHARRMVISSPGKVLRAGALVGILATMCSLLFGTVTLVRKIIAPDSIQVQGWTSTFLIVIFFGGLTTFLIGVMMEYITNMLLHAQGKPAFYVVDRSSDARISSWFKNEK